MVLSADEQNRADECEECEARTDAELRRERERANEWEGLAVGRLATVEQLKVDVAVVEDACGRSDLIAAQRLEKMNAGNARIALLEKSLRFIERVDKTPVYRCKGTRADKDRHGQLPKKSGQRWKTPREIVGDLKLPAE